MKTQLTLTQNAYITDDGLFYTAAAIDSDNTTYDIYYAVIDCDADDASDACNWNNYSIKKDGKELNAEDFEIIE